MWLNFANEISRKKVAAFICVSVMIISGLFQAKGYNFPNIITEHIMYMSLIFMGIHSFNNWFATTFVKNIIKDQNGDPKKYIGQGEKFFIYIATVFVLLFIGILKANNINFPDEMITKILTISSSLMGFHSISDISHIVKSN